MNLILSLSKSVLIVLLLFTFTRVSSAEEVVFSKGTYQEILDLAKKENKIVMIDFITDCCKWCVETDRKVYTNQEVYDFANSNQINWKIDAEKGEGPDLAKKYGVKGFPTIIFADANGTEIDRIYGYLPADQFLIKMKDYNNGVNTFGSISKMLESDPNDAAANYLMAEKISSNGLDGDVKVYLEKTITLDPSNEKGYTDNAKFMLAYVNEDPVTIQSLIDQYPTSDKVKDAYLTMASIYAGKENYDQANKAFEDALNKYGSDDFDVKQNYGGYLMGVAYGTMKNENSTEAERNDAVKLLNKCLPFVEGTVNEASVYYILSDLYLQNKDIKKANESIDMAIKLYDKKSYQEQKVKINSQEANK